MALGRWQNGHAEHAGRRGGPMAAWQNPPFGSLGFEDPIDPIIDAIESTYIIIK